MTESEIYGRLDVLFREIIGDDAIKLRPGTTADDVEGWDSVAHISIIVAIETEFQIRIRIDEMEELKNVGDMVQLIHRQAH